MLARITEDGWDVFSGMEWTESGIGESGLLGGYSACRSASQPRVNVYQNDEGVVLTAELPGVDPAKIDISLEGDMLTLRGVREEAKAEEEIKFYLRERSYGEFERKLRLPFMTGPSGLEASCKNGVLTIKAAKPEEQKPKRITVKSL